MSEEVWQTLENFSNYEISSFGNIRNKKTTHILHLRTLKTPIFYKDIFVKNI